MHKRLKKFITLSALAITLTSAASILLITNSQNVAHASTRQQAVDDITDQLFKNLHPQLGGRKLRSHEYRYIQEWQAIWKVVNQAGVIWTNQNTKTCLPEWSFPGGEALQERLADAVFYSRYPGRNGAAISPNERSAIREWLNIKNSMWVTAYC